ncbi:DUF4114 domain-containing protein [Tolypothrix bouteillei VB521301]|uniref:DUF4114 domain-containing protein n=1 Tax=Tolypothrix bouteillei VB521301 TaxID=1479485 RepID=A0A8S9TIV9_9CYAN|nr:DUF4114 domain-containing protein [Tolypothrix bouteillei VB521301]
MNKNQLKKLIAAAATVAGVFSTVAPASASTFTWGDWTKTYEVQDKSTDTSGFQTLISEYQKYVQPESLAIPEDKLTKLDPTKLRLKNESNVRIWFLNEGATYKNQLAYEAVKGNNSQKGLLFNDVSCDISQAANSACQLGENPGTLDIGDYVELGKVAGGSQLNFFMKTDGFNNPDGPVYGADPTKNPDLLEHLVAYEIDDYLLIGFEDLPGPEGISSDRDFNDVVFVVDVGKDNIESVPEPATAMALLAASAAGVMTLRRRESTTNDQ